MPKQGTRVEVNSFVRGLITEASPLNFPANASFDEVNFELNRDGTRQRRLGMDYEKEHYQHYATALNGGQFDRVAGNSYVWSAPSMLTDLTFLVVQMGNQITFHKVIDENTPVSARSSYAGVFTLVYEHTVPYSFASINGKLVVAGGGTHVAVFTYDSTADLFSLNYVPLKVRDIWGLEELPETENDPAFRPTTLDKAHEYNLCNQSWGISRKYKNSVLPAPITVNPITQYVTDLSKYPSNSEVVWTGLQFQSVDSFNQTPYERLFSNLYEDRIGLDMSAAKGYFILDLHNRGTSRRSAMDANSNKFPGMPTGQAYPDDYMTSGASVVGAYAGRVWYAGFTSEVIDGDKRSPILNDYVFFSNLVRNDNDINACYQSGDPTSRDNSDVVDTDGGFLRVLGAKRIIALANLGKHLVIVATNGVWAVTGGNDYGFSATNFKVDKVSSFGCIARSSLVEVNDAIFYWGAEAIYKVAYDQMGNLSADDFSTTVIDSYYDNIQTKAECTGVYDAVHKKIRWIYRTDGLMTPNYMATELVYDTVLNCYYQHKIPGHQNTNLIGIFLTQEVGVKYLALNQLGSAVTYTVCDYHDPDFVDWYTIDGTGVDAKAYMLTGAITAGDSGIDKQAPYLQLHFRRTETVVGDDGLPKNASSCMMRCQWEWSNKPKSKKFTDLVETYRYQLPLFVSPGDDYDNGFDTVISKTKLRGKGKAISLYFETSPYKDCQLLGWNLTVNGNAIT